MPPTGPNKFQIGITTKGHKSQTRFVLCQYKFIYQISSPNLKGRLRKSWKTEWADTKCTDRSTDRRTDAHL